MRQVRLLEMLGRKVVDSEGVTLGHLQEIETERGADSCPVQAYLVEHRGLLDRMSSWTLTSSMQKALSRRSSKKPYRVPWDEMDLSDPRHPRTLVPKSALRRLVE